MCIWSCNQGSSCWPAVFPRHTPETVLYRRHHFPRCFLTSSLSACSCPSVGTHSKYWVQIFQQLQTRPYEFQRQQTSAVKTSLLFLSEELLTMQCSFPGSSQFPSPQLSKLNYQGTGFLAPNLLFPLTLGDLLLPFGLSPVPCQSWGSLIWSVLPVPLSNWLSSNSFYPVKKLIIPCGEL